MHNCKITRNSLIDLTLDEIPETRSSQLLAELDECPACREEYAALRSTLHVSNQALRSALPGEEFWPGYRARLHSKLAAAGSAHKTENVAVVSSSALPVSLPVSFSSQLWLALRTLATASVRVPIPAALALLLVFGVFVFVLRARGQAAPPKLAPVATVEPKTIQVPVIQEKLVTRVVYVEKKSRRSGNNASQSDGSKNFGGGASDASNRTALSLVGFEPTDEVKLTIIRGSYKEEKR